MIKSAICSFTDEQLVEQYRNGNQKALGILYERYFAKVKQKCFSYSKDSDEAYDLAQDILIKAFSKIYTFMGHSSFSSWLFVIATNHCITQLRKYKNIHFEDIAHCYNLYDETPDLDVRLDYEMKEESLNNKLEEISEQDRKLLLLKYHHNYSILDLQKEFNLNASAVKMRLQRARHKMEQKMTRRQLQIAV
jgi:RNA polymerase sigma factor (sigma-70 family)